MLEARKAWQINTYLRGIPFIHLFIYPPSGSSLHILVPKGRLLHKYFMYLIYQTVFRDTKNTASFFPRPLSPPHLYASLCALCRCIDHTITHIDCKIWFVCPICSKRIKLYETYFKLWLFFDWNGLNLWI